MIQRILLAAGFIVISIIANNFVSDTTYAAWVDADISNSPVLNYEEAVNYVNNLCDSPSYMARRIDGVYVRANVAVAAYPTDAQFNNDTGEMTYTANLVWRGCFDDASRAFAITGYPNQGTGSGLATCPNAGDYAELQTYDCIKYTYNSAGHFGGWAELSCPPGINDKFNYQCVTGGSSSSGLFYSVIERREMAPSTSIQTASQPVTSSSVPDWGNATKLSGSHSFARADAFCTYYKWDPGLSHWANCVGIRIDVSWERHNYNLVPTVSTNRTTGEAGSDLQVTPTVNNEGPTASRGTDWSLYTFNLSPGEAIPAGGTSSLPGDVFYGHGANKINGGSGVIFNKGILPLSSSSQIVPDLEIGSRVCYGLSVRPYNHTTGDARHSTPACTIVTKSPKVQVLGSDLWVGRGTAAATARVAASRTQVGDTHYGSWSEYGIVTPTRITGMASAAGYSGGTTQGNYCSLSLLTFANTTSSGSCNSNDVGGYAIATSSPALSLMGTLATRATANISGARDIASLAADTVYSATGNVTLTSSATIPKGKWVVISAPGRTVTVASNIAYSNVITKDADESSRALLGALPQVVIIAQNIIVNEAVAQIDAWLVATDTIHTCSISNVAELGGDVCTTRLTVNGPVITDRLLLYRTAGAGTGAAAGDPAEVFNLRPDAYLWATALQNETARVKTVEFKELPPRY